LLGQEPKLEKVSPDRAEAMDPELRHRIEQRAYSLWELDGCPEGRALDYWLQAEQEIVNQGVSPGACPR
jgi:hypothetical protein